MEEIKIEAMDEGSHIENAKEDQEFRLKIAICDDEPGTCSEIEEAVMKFARQKGLDIRVELFYTGEALYHYMVKVSSFDLIFLDIRLERLSGVDIGRMIREELRNEKTQIVYISSRQSYAMHLFAVRPMDFLIKPLSEERICEKVGQYLALTRKQKDFFSFTSDRTLYRVLYQDILYFQCDGKKIRVVQSGGVKEFYGRMRDVETAVEYKGFWTIHKSYVINSIYVIEYRYDSIKMANGDQLPVSQRYRNEVRRKLLSEYAEGERQ